MAAVVANNCFSVFNSTVKFRSFPSRSRSATLQRSTASLTPKAIGDRRTVSGSKRRSYSANYSSGNSDVERESTVREPFLQQSKDGVPLLYQRENNARRNPGRLQTAAFKSFGMQRKDEKELVDAIEPQVEPGNLQDAAFLNAVVKVYCTHTAPDYSLPWQKQRQYTSTGSAFMIGDGKLLTNAHCVEHDTQVKVKKRGDDTKYVAKVLLVEKLVFLS